MTTVNVFLVDPQRLLREGIKSLLHNTSFHIMGESSELCEAIDKLERGIDIDLVLLDLPDGGQAALDRLQATHRAAPKAKMVVLTTNFDGWLLSHAAEVGICGLLQKDISPVALLHSLELVMLGERVFPIHNAFLPIAGEESARSKGDDPAEAEQRHPADLSSREVQILRYLTNGLANKAIARELNLAETTVKAHIKTILRKIKAGNRTQAAIWCLTTGINEAGTDGAFGASGESLSLRARPGGSWYHGDRRSIGDPALNKATVPDPV